MTHRAGTRPSLSTGGARHAPASMSVPGGTTFIGAAALLSGHQHRGSAHLTSAQPLQGLGHPLQWVDLDLGVDGHLGC